MIHLKTNKGDLQKVVKTLGTYGEWSVHRPLHWPEDYLIPYDISHKPTGLKACEANSLAEARHIAKELSQVPPAPPQENLPFQDYFKGLLTSWVADEVLPKLKTLKRI